MIRKNLKVALDKKKSYANLKIMHREFRVEDQVYLRWKPKRRSMKLKSCVMLAPRYCGPFEVLDRIGHVSYRIAFLAHMKAHNDFMSHFLRNMVMILIMLLIRM